ncbi:MAG: DUF983 domain-containing protein [Thermomicrobiales bacterium]|nr:DUF983 domain-containing protein [Thermomicrobiales bacterium]
MDAKYPNQPNTSSNGLARAGTGLGRALLRRCPFCGAKHIFENWFTLKKQCPGCGSVFEPEDGYMLGSYVVNLGLTAVIGVLFAVSVVFGTDLSVIAVQIAAVVLVVGLPLFLYGYSQLFWICIDLVFNSTQKFDPAQAAGRAHHHHA